jgi:hypothetical protein
MMADVSRQWELAPTRFMPALAEPFGQNAGARFKSLDTVVLIRILVDGPSGD